MSYPYISGPGNLGLMIEKLRNNFPNTVTSETVKQIGLASGNESSIINALQFIGLIDEGGKKNTEKAKAFLNQKDDEFESAFSKIVQEAYKDLFDVHGEEAWMLDSAGLTTFFRQTDQTSEVIGKRQTGVFKTLAALSGKSEQPMTRSPSKQNTSKAEPTKTTKNKATVKSKADTSKTVSVFDRLGMSIKIEVNLPSDASKETYDNIFRSIREHLIDG